MQLQTKKKHRLWLIPLLFCAVVLVYQYFAVIQQYYNTENAEERAFILQHGLSQIITKLTIDGKLYVIGKCDGAIYASEVAKGKWRTYVKADYCGDWVDPLSNFVFDKCIIRISDAFEANEIVVVQKVLSHMSSHEYCTKFPADTSNSQFHSVVSNDEPLTVYFYWALADVDIDGYSIIP